MKKGSTYALVALGTMALVRAAQAQGMTDQPDDRSSVSSPQDDNRTNSATQPSGAGADIPPNPNEDVGEVKNLPDTPGLPEAHGPNDTSPGNAPSRPEAPPSPGY